MIRDMNHWKDLNQNSWKHFPYSRQELIRFSRSYGATVNVIERRTTKGIWTLIYTKYFPHSGRELVRFTRSWVQRSRLLKSFPAKVYRSTVHRRIPSSFYNINIHVFALKLNLLIWRRKDILWRNLMYLGRTSSVWIFETLKTFFHKIDFIGTYSVLPGSLSVDGLFFISFSKVYGG